MKKINMDKKTNKLLLDKLRQPIHIDYISKYILKESMEETMKHVNKLIEDNIIEESKYSKNYYVIKNKFKGH
jgi:hypothetical protein